MKKLLPLLVLLIVLISCKNKKPKNELLTPANLKSQLFLIDPEKDTLLRTSHAATLRISKGTFKTNSPVSIEIKEAYTPVEILMAGMTTTSDGKPLRSAGMLYFNATAGGKKIKPAIPVEATIPAKDPDPAMQVFKGEEKSDGTIDWVAPVAIDTVRPIADEQLMGRGFALYQKCGSCHGIFHGRTGPAFKNLQFRGPWKNPANILAWVRNPAAFMAKDQYTRDLKEKYGSMMTAFPDLTMDDVKALLHYITVVKEEPKNPTITNRAKLDTAGKHTDLYHCGTDTVYYSTKNEFEEYDTTIYPTVLPDTTVHPASPYDPIFRDIYNEGYDFEIRENGWYNIDDFVKENAADFKNVELIADLVMKEEAYMNVYVFLPSERLMQNTTNKKGDQYYFDLENGKIPLPLRYRAIIFAFCSVKDKIIYGVSEFTIREKQLIPVEIKETTKEGLMNLLHSKNINGVQLDAIEKKMEILKRPCPGAEGADEYDMSSADIEPGNQRADSVNKK